MKQHYLVLFLLMSILVAGCQFNDQSFREFQNPADTESRYPYLFTSDSTLYMSWLGTTNNGSALNYASYSTGQWSDVQTAGTDSSRFINWADFPSIIANESGPMAIHWLHKKSGGPYAYDVNIAFAQEQGRWSEPITPHNDRTATEHGFVSMVPWDSDTILAVWLDGRQSAHRSEKDYYDLDYAMTLRGALISTAGKVERKFLIDDAVCDCCPTSLIKTTDGAIVAYRNRTDNEIRDIYISRFNGVNWSDGIPINDDGWKIGACPVNGPVLAARDSLVGITWYTAAHNRPVVKAALSTDNGRSFRKVHRVSKQASAGRVDLAIHKQKAYISWMGKANKKAALNYRSIHFDKGQKLSEVTTADSIDASRKSGFPQLQIVGNQLIMAWTDLSQSPTTIKTVRKNL